MYQPFRITTVRSEFTKKRIIVYTSHDILEDSINDSTVQVFEKSSRNFLELKFKVEEKRLLIEFFDWPIPNEEYILKVGAIKNILDEECESTLRRQIVFKSEIKNTVKITNPSNYEKIKEVFIKWTEDNPEEKEEYINNYYLEISNDNAFYKIIKNIDISEKKEITIVDLPEGQYYIRCRAQDEKSYGTWSDTTTFTISGKNSIIEEEEDSENIAPIFEDDLYITSKPIDGKTPKSIIIKFSELIDSEFIKDIVLTRSDI